MQLIVCEYPTPTNRSARKESSRNSWWNTGRVDNA